LVSSAEKVNFATCSNAWLLLFLAFMMLYRFLTVGLLLSSVSLHAQNVTTDSTLVDSTKTIDLREVVVSQKVVQHKANKDVYIITPQIREGAFTAIDLLK
jgi:hypothetical protein